MHGSQPLAIVLSAILGGSPAPLAAQRAPDAAIRRVALSLLERVTTVDGPGAVLLVARGDRVVFRAARGRANIELGVALSPDHVFRIASVTKMFTAATVLKLAEAGQLSLDDRLATHLPDFPGADTITIRQLLNHTAGISDVVKDPQPGFSRRDITTEIRIGEIRKRPLDFAPGTRWRYSNAGYIVLGAVIERIAGQPWHATLQQTLLDPLGLKQTRFGSDGPLMPGRVSGYTRDAQSREIRNAGYINMTVPDAAGALVSTAGDLLTWMRSLIRYRLLSEESVEQMTTAASPEMKSPLDDIYGMGLYLWQVRNRPMIGHTGQINGFTASIGYLPEDDITAIVLANDDSFDARVVGRQLAAIALGHPYPNVVAVQFTSDELRDFAGRYVLDDDTVLTLTARDGALYWQRGKGRELPLQKSSTGNLHFVPDALTYVTPIRNANGRVIALDYFRDGDGPPHRLRHIP
jgi:CubicO group peptidase (beta-lactamase class C family)